MAIPKYKDLMLPLLEEYKIAEGPVTIVELIPILSKKLGLSDADMAERMRSNSQGVFHNRLLWAKTYMTKAGLLETVVRGQTQITKRGHYLLNENPFKIDGKTLARFDGFSEWRDHRKNAQKSISANDS